MARTSTDTRQRLLLAADRLFYSQGIRAVGVDAIAEAAGLTKRTLYYHFASKDDLIAAYLDARDLPTLERYRNLVADAKAPAATRIRRIFDLVEKNAKDPGWRGCSFVRAATEFAGTELAGLAGHPARIGAARHKKRFETWLKDLLADDGHADAAALARQIVILFDGAVTQILIHRDTSYARSAGAAALSLLRASRPVARPKPARRGTNSKK